ncbi:FixH family protein [Rhizobium sp. TRM95111]|uniref:FixH family protein n=1 Tax=Rhizobium alarense TaxID=2846851 RepID=UPI001F406A60|nr:FixH family protein [Rhizobium alarense]MCF3640096.1 FixH family protein [Rhizobium alarense]
MRQNASGTQAGGFTGWHMLAVMGLFFGIIISVNLVMAWNAVSSWSGLVVQNTYVASQEFNSKVERARALAASGISGTLTVATDGVDYRLVDRGGQPVTADTVRATFKRPVDERDDFVLVLQPAGEGSYRVVHAVATGQWVVDVVAERSGKAVFHETVRTVVGGGAR